MKKIFVLMMAAWCWSFGALAAISQQLKNEYNEAYMTVLAAAGCVESYLDCEEKENSSFLKTCGWQVNYYEGGSKKLKTHFFIAKKDTTAGDTVYMIVFRGTANLKDWGFNLKTGHCAYAGNNLAAMEQAAAGPYTKELPAVHKGFNVYVERVLKNHVLQEDGATLKGVFAEVRDNPRCRLLVAGHSLGGAAAALLGQRLYDLGLSPEKFLVMTFGAPAVGNAAFVEKFGNRISLLRYTTTADPVPFSVQTLFGDYKHFGRHINYDVDIRYTDNQHNSTLYLDNAFLGYYAARQKLEKSIGKDLRPVKRIVAGVPLVGVQVSLSPEASKYRYMGELREFLLDQYAAGLPSFKMFSTGQAGDDCRYKIFCEINARQDRKENAWYVEVMQNLYDGKILLAMAIYSKKVTSGSGNVKTLAENWLDAREDLRKLLPFFNKDVKLILLGN